MKPLESSTEIDHLLDQLIHEFLPSFKSTGKVIQYDPLESVGKVLINTPVLEKLVRNIFRSIHLFAYDAHTIQVSVRTVHTFFLLSFECECSLIPPPLKKHLLQSASQQHENSTNPTVYSNEQMLAWAKKLGGTFSNIEMPDSGLFYSLQLPLKRPSNDSTHEQGNHDSSTFLTPPDINTSRYNTKLSGKERLLIIEDDKTFCEILELEFASSFTLEIVHNGKEALDVLETHSFDIILCDVMMPEMNGFEFVKTVKSRQKYQNVPILLLSSLAETTNVVEGLSTGAEAYLMKPISIDLLKAHLQGALIRANSVKQLMDSNSLSIIQKVDLIISEHMGNPDLNVDKIADLLSMSRSTFYRLWSETEEQSINKRLLTERLNFAHVMLKSNNYSIGQIAHACGFSDQSYFTKVFKKWFGFLPSKVPSP